MCVLLCRFTLRRAANTNGRQCLNEERNVLVDFLEGRVYSTVLGVYSLIFGVL